MRDPERRRLFYYNRVTGVNTYEKPDLFKTKQQIELDEAQAAAAEGRIDHVRCACMHACVRVCVRACA